ncbi:MAG TPA: ABC transporter permease [Jiangellaceae bacterium]|jgi:lipooligosaccharide transport system permease protein|nr:ABC transporter permease [Jiangellaceae bacterium]
MSTAAHAVARALPLPVGAGLARTLVERNMRAFRHGWLVLVSGFFEPIFYLFSLGIGLGALIGDIETGNGQVVEYAVFVAPALLASAAMNGAVYDATFNIFFKLKYAKLYDSVLATPLGPRDIAVGEISWALLRGLFYSVAFLLVAVVAGVVTSWWSILAIPAASLIGFAFAAVGMAATTFMRSWQDFDYVQLAILPMFLFSATFYPLSTYAEPWQLVVQATPLYHGVALVRGLMLGEIGADLLVHVTYLAVMGLVGTIFAARRIERLLLR